MKDPLNAHPNIRAKGRPLGYLAAWLAKAHTYDSKEDHWLPANAPTLADRKRARQMLADRDDGFELLMHERDKFPDEESEPEGQA